MALFRQFACIETAEQKNDHSLRSDMGKSLLKSGAKRTPYSMFNVGRSMFDVQSKLIRLHQMKI
jgi:hypothetical protein